MITKTTSKKNYDPLDSISFLVEKKQKDLNNAKDRLNNLENRYKDTMSVMDNLKNAQNIISERAWSGLMRFKEHSSFLQLDPPTHATHKGMRMPQGTPRQAVHPKG